jgi:hypothetical protein
LKDWCQFWGFLNGVAEDSVLLKYDATSMGNRIPAFRCNAMSSSSRIEIPKKEYFDTETLKYPTLHRNVGITQDAASYARMLILYLFLYFIILYVYLIKAQYFSRIW